ncbi:hypothetical protein CBE01nite_19540 [Clostridium beijerinckii]|nr:hypothetical protein CBE01nite_19540 [Clostridium beijerinckii]
MSVKNLYFDSTLIKANLNKRKLEKVEVNVTPSKLIPPKIKINRLLLYFTIVGVINLKQDI